MNIFNNKYCINCKHARKLYAWRTYCEQLICTHWGCQDFYYTLKGSVPSVETIRRNNELCGLEGKWYSKKGKN